MENTLLPQNDTRLLAPDNDPALVYISTLSESSRRVVWESLTKIADILTGGKISEPRAIPWGDLRYQHATLIRSFLHETMELSPATVNRELSFLRGVCKQAWLLGQMDGEDFHRLKAVPGIRNQSLPAGKMLTTGDIRALMTVCKDDKNEAKGVRDASIIAIMYICGLRRTEIVQLTLDNYNRDERLLSVISGKGNKDRRVPIGPAQRPLADWLIHRNGIEANELFLPVNRGGNLQKRKLSAQAIYNMANKRAEEAGISKFSPHDLRHTSISMWLDKTDAISVAQFAGHSSVNTTMRYDHRPDQDRIKTADQLFLPY